MIIYDYFLLEICCCCCFLTENHKKNISQKHIGRPRQQYIYLYICMIYATGWCPLQAASRRVLWGGRNTRRVGSSWERDARSTYGWLLANLVWKPLGQQTAAEFDVRLKGGTGKRRAGTTRSVVSLWVWWKRRRKRTSTTLAMLGKCVRALFASCWFTVRVSLLSLRLRLRLRLLFGAWR